MDEKIDVIKEAQKICDEEMYRANTYFDKGYLKGQEDKEREIKETWQCERCKQYNYSETAEMFMCDNLIQCVSKDFGCIYFDQKEGEWIMDLIWYGILSYCLYQFVLIIISLILVLFY